MPASFSFAINCGKLRAARRREGRYLLRANLCGHARTPVKLCNRRRGWPSASPKKTPGCDAVFANVAGANAAADADGGKCLRPSVDTKATVVLGAYSRRGRARGLKPVAALDHDMAKGKAKLIPVGILEVKGGDLDLTFSTSAAKTSDLLGDCVSDWWGRHGDEHPGLKALVLNLDNGPESSGRRTQCLWRMADFADRRGRRVHLVYYPPYHRKYNPVEHC